MVSKSVALGKRQLSDELKFRHGQLAYPARARRVRGFRNLDGGAAQVETITVDTYSDGDNLVVVFTSDDGEITITYTMTTADTNEAGAASSLAAKLNAHPNIRKHGKAVASGDDVVFTGRFVGKVFTFAVSATGSGAISTTTSTPASSPGAIAYGTAVLYDGSTSSGDMKGKPVDVDGLTKMSIVIAHGETASGQVVLKFDDQIYKAAGADAAALNTALDAALPTGLSSSVASTDVTITVDTAGDVFELVDLSGDVSLDTYTKGDRLDDKLAGISCYTDLSADSEGYGAERLVDVCEDGEVSLEIASATLDDLFFVGTTGDEKSVIYRARAANRVRLSRLKACEVIDGHVVDDVLRRH